MAPPSSKPYTTLAPPTDDDEELELPSPSYRDNPEDEEFGDIAEQSPELQAASANNRRRSCRRYTFAVFGVVAVASVLFGGKYYYDRGEVPGFVSEFLGAHGRGDDFTEENVGVRGSPNEDQDIAQELFEGANENGNGMMATPEGYEEALEFEEEEIEEIEASEEREPGSEEVDFGGEAHEQVGEVIHQEQEIGDDEQEPADEETVVNEENSETVSEPAAVNKDAEVDVENTDSAIEEAMTISTAYTVVEQVKHDPSSFT
jgi:hypothetical protein